METNQAAEHLQVIRTLMERSALYRRALAPIMIYCGLVGIVGGITGWVLKIGNGFILFWSAFAVLALTGALIMVRRQALKDAEPFWSPPTKRIMQALSLPLAAGLILNSVVSSILGHESNRNQILYVAIWVIFYGCAVHSAGFFMVRGVRFWGVLFFILGDVLLPNGLESSHYLDVNPHLLMAAIFGGLHLAFGIYLYFTEDRNTAP